uniref:Uncharacterized protein n=2 Tax=Avena sativa TaxID=4498 RepID=A0ACD5YIC5_AVESA
MDDFPSIVIGTVYFVPDMVYLSCAVIGHAPLPHAFHHRQMGAGTILSRFGTTAWSPWSSCHGPYWVHGRPFLGSKPYNSTATEAAEAFLRTQAQHAARAASTTGESMTQGCPSRNDYPTMNHQHKRMLEATVRTNDDVHVPLDLDLSLGIAAPRSEMKRKRSGCSWMIEDDGQKQMDEISISLSLFTPGDAPQKMSTSSSTAVDVSVGIKREEDEHATRRASTLGLTI